MYLCGVFSCLHKTFSHFSHAVETSEGSETEDVSLVAQLKELLRLANEELESARANSTALEEKAQQAAEKALALHDQAAATANAADTAMMSIQVILEKEVRVEENLAAVGAKVAAAQEKFTRAENAFQVARWKLEPPGTSLDDLSSEIPESLAEQQPLETNMDDGKGEADSETPADSQADGQSKPDQSDSDESKSDDTNVQGKLVKEKDTVKEYQLMESTKAELLACETALAECEAELSQLQITKMELQKEAMRRSELAQVAQEAAALADDDVAAAMVLAEQAVALEVEAAQRVGDAEIALHKAEVSAEDVAKAAAAKAVAALAAAEAEKLSHQVVKTTNGVPDLKLAEDTAVALEPEEKVGDYNHVFIHLFGIVNCKDSQSC